MDRTSSQGCGRPPLHPASFHGPQTKSYAGAAGSTFSPANSSDINKAQSEGAVDITSHFRVRSHSRTKRGLHLHPNATGNNSDSNPNPIAFQPQSLITPHDPNRHNDSKYGTRNRKVNLPHAHRAEGVHPAASGLHAPPILDAPPSPYMWPGTNMLQFGIVCDDPPTTQPSSYPTNSYLSPASHPSSSYYFNAQQNASSHSVPSFYPAHVPPVYDNPQAPLYQSATIGIPLNCPNCHCVWLLRAIQVNNPVMVEYPRPIEIPSAVSMPVSNFSPATTTTSPAASSTGGTIEPKAPLQMKISVPYEAEARQISAPVSISCSAKEGSTKDETTKDGIISMAKSTEKALVVATNGAPPLSAPPPSAPMPSPSALPREVLQTSKSIVLPPLNAITGESIAESCGSRSVSKSAAPTTPIIDRSLASQNIPEGQQTAIAVKMSIVEKSEPLLPQIGSRGKKASSSPMTPIRQAVLVMNAGLAQVSRTSPEIGKLGPIEIVPALNVSTEKKASTEIAPPQVLRTIEEKQNGHKTPVRNGDVANRDKDMVAKSDGAAGSIPVASDPVEPNDARPCSSSREVAIAILSAGRFSKSTVEDVPVADRTSRRRTAKRLARRRRKASGSITSDDGFTRALNDAATAASFPAEIPIVMLVQRDKTVCLGDSARPPTDVKVLTSAKTSDLQTMPDLESVVALDVQVSSSGQSVERGGSANPEKKQSPTSNRKRYKPRKITRHVIQESVPVSASATLQIENHASPILRAEVEAPPNFGKEAAASPKCAEKSADSNLSVNPFQWPDSARTVFIPMDSTHSPSSLSASPATYAAASDSASPATSATATSAAATSASALKPPEQSAAVLESDGKSAKVSGSETAYAVPEVVSLKTDVPVSTQPYRSSENPTQTSVPIRRSLPLTKSQKKKKKEKERRKAEKEGELVKIEAKKGVDVFLSTPQQIVEAVQGAMNLPPPNADANLELVLGTKRGRLDTEKVPDDVPEKRSNSARLSADLEHDRQKAVRLINAARLGLMATNETADRMLEPPNAKRSPSVQPAPSASASVQPAPSASASASRSDLTKSIGTDVKPPTNGTPPHSPFIHTVTKIMRLALLQMAVDHDAAAFAAWIAAFPEVDDRLHIFGADEIRLILRTEDPGTDRRSRNIAMNQMSVSASAGASTVDPLTTIGMRAVRARLAVAEEHPVLEAEKQAIARLEKEWRNTTSVVRDQQSGGVRTEFLPTHQTAEFGPKQVGKTSYIQQAVQFHPLTSFNLRTPLKYVTARDIEQYRRLAPPSSALLHTVLSLLGETARANELRHVASMIALCSATSPTEHFVIFFRVPTTQEPLSAATRRLRTEWWSNAHRNLDAQTATLRALITQVPFNGSMIMRNMGRFLAAADMIFMLETFCSPDAVGIPLTMQVYPSPSQAPSKPVIDALRAHLKNTSTATQKKPRDRRERLSPHVSAAERVARQLQEHQRKLTAHEDEDEAKEKETDSSESSDGEKEYKPMMDDSHYPIMAVSKTKKGILAQLANPNVTRMDARGYTDQVLKRLFSVPTLSLPSPSIAETTPDPLSSSQVEEGSAPFSMSYSSVDIQGLRRFGACALCHNPWGLTPIMACQYCFLFVCSKDCQEIHADIHTPAACDAHQLRLQPILDDLSGGDGCASCHATATHTQVIRCLIRSMLPIGFGKASPMPIEDYTPFVAYAGRPGPSRRLDRGSSSSSDDRSGNMTFPGVMGTHSAAAIRRRRLSAKPKSDGTRTPLSIVVDYCDIGLDWSTKEHRLATTAFHHLTSTVQTEISTAASDIFFVNCPLCCTVVYCSFSCRDRDMQFHRLICRRAAAVKTYYEARSVTEDASNVKAAGREEAANGKSGDTEGASNVKNDASNVKPGGLEHVSNAAPANEGAEFFCALSQSADRLAQTAIAADRTNTRPPILGLSIPGGTDLDATRRMLEQFCSTHSASDGPPVIVERWADASTCPTPSPLLASKESMEKASKESVEKAKKLKRNQKKRNATHRKKAALLGANPTITAEAIMSAIRIMNPTNQGTSAPSEKMGLKNASID